MLMKLPNGDWLDPRAVVSIVRRGLLRGHGGEVHPNRLVIHRRDGLVNVVFFESEEDRDAYADQLAQACNEATEG